MRIYTIIIPYNDGTAGASYDKVTAKLTELFGGWTMQSGAGSYQGDEEESVDIYTAANLKGTPGGKADAEMESLARELAVLCGQDCIYWHFTEDAHAFLTANPEKNSSGVLNAA